MLDAHTNLVHIYRHYIIEDSLIFVEMEAPQNVSKWKAFCKKKFSTDEILTIMKHVGQGLEYIH